MNRLAVCAGDGFSEFSIRHPVVGADVMSHIFSVLMAEIISRVLDT